MDSLICIIPGFSGKIQESVLLHSGTELRSNVLDMLPCGHI
ncbi:Uncharacterized protein dnm_053930 [Desulfonema magnum]|uniref:Uncharacterized protein n=1 Tax=Desulfonema magnum TaxID=45655 RepID=A0A975BQ70_9BACT|nr:Uncharacterized protein dnm_053930 [Desulfonema magnum]